MFYYFSGESAVQLFGLKATTLHKYIFVMHKYIKIYRNVFKFIHVYLNVFMYLNIISENIKFYFSVLKYQFSVGYRVPAGYYQSYKG